MPEITLKHATTCRRCSAPLDLGSRATWDPASKAVTCVRCATSTAAPSRRPRSAATRGTPVEPGALHPWPQLVEYHRRAVVRAGVAEPVPVAQRGTWRVLSLDSERLITGTDDSLPLSPAAASIFADLPPTESVYYGWPVVLLQDRRGGQRVAPVLMTEVILPDPKTREAVPRDDEPYLNPGLLTEDFFAAEDLALLDAALTTALPQGDPKALTRRVLDLLTGLGFTDVALDPAALAVGGAPTPGVHNRAMLFRGRSDDATRALATELAELRERPDWSTTAAGALLDLRNGTTRAHATASPDSPGLVGGLPPLMARSLRLNDSQEQALESALRERVTVVTGPPGTGKSQLVAAIVANQWLAGRSVLVASMNNTAVDVAVARAAAVDPALLIRTGNLERRQALTETLAPLAGRYADPGMSTEIIRRRLDAAAQHRHDVIAELVARSTAEIELAQAIRDLEGMRTLLWGSPDLEPTRATRRQLHTRVAKRRSSRWFVASHDRKILALARPSSPGARADDVLKWAALDARVADLAAHLTALGPTDSDVDRAQLEAADDAWSRAGNDALDLTLGHAVANAQAHIGQLRLARTQDNAGALRSTITRSVGHLRGWACTALTARANFALTPGLFDLLVIDEASQCSLAQILPLAYRARRIVVVGDPNQLTPIVTLNRTHLESIATACGTSERAVRDAHTSAITDSAFTAFDARVARPFLLDEHYRCHPQIAGFINRQFYAGALQVLTDVTADRGEPRGLHFIDVAGRTERAVTSGVYNQAEVDAVVAWIVSHPLAGASLGVVTPFAAQADRIRRALRSALEPAELDALRLTIGTAHAFQGGECDVVLFSLALAEGTPLGTATWVEAQRNLINVAVSRARRALIVFGDALAIADLPVPTLHALVSEAQSTHSSSVPTPTDLAEVADLHSEAERRMYAALVRAGWAVTMKPVIEGYELDFTVTSTDGRLINVEVDGTQHVDARGRARRQDLARDAVLQSMGLPVVRVPAWECLADADDVVRRVLPHR